MAIESKMLLVAIGAIMRKSDSLEDAYKDIEAMANVEGVTLQPFSEGKTNKKESANHEKNA
jgi:hypothetical protein